LDNSNLDFAFLGVLTPWRLVFIEW